MKRILSMMLMVAMIIGIFTGCGAGADNAGASMEKITVSEMLANVVEENDGEAVIFTYTSNNYKNEVSEKLKWMAYAYTNESIQTLSINDDSVFEYTLDEFNNSDSYTKGISDGLNWKIDVTRKESPVQYVSENNNKNASLTFGKCEHVTLNDESYMLFKAYKYDYVEGFKTTHFTLVKDTEFTKDKLVVVDTIEGDITRTWNLESKFYDHAWFAELTDEDKAASGIK